jgi:hypothetical protein
MYNACLLLGVCDPITFTGIVVSIHQFDAVSYADAFSVIMGRHVQPGKGDIVLRL